MAKTSDTVHVGIDLGTSRSAISAENSQRHLIDSFVGWPVDLVARKILKKEVLIGREALDNRTMLDLRRPLERGIIKEGAERDAMAVREILQYLLSLVGLDPGVKDRPRIRAVVGAPAEALRVNKEQLRSAMKGLADHVMIVSEPFAVAYGQEALLHTLIIDIGAGTTDFCVMNGHYPTEEDQRTLDTAGDFVDMRLFSLVQEQHPEAQFTMHMVRSWKEQWGFVGKTKGRATVSAPVAGKPTDIVITDEVRTACEMLVPPITETMLDLIARVEPEFQEAVRENVILAGGGAMVGGLREALESALSNIGGGKVRVVSNPDHAGSDGALAIALDAQDADWDVL